MPPEPPISTYGNTPIPPTAPPSYGSPIGQPAFQPAPSQPPMPSTPPQGLPSYAPTQQPETQTSGIYAPVPHQPQLVERGQADFYGQQAVSQPMAAQTINQLEEDWFAADQFEGQLAVDVYQTPNDIVVKAPIAGVAPNDIDISLTDDVLTIKGRRVREENARPEDYFCQECYYGVFSRSIILPTAVATDQSDAAFINGVLTITIPKAEKARTKRLNVMQ